MDELPGTCGELLELLGAIASASRRQSEAAARLQEPGFGVETFQRPSHLKKLCMGVSPFAWCLGSHWP